MNNRLKQFFRELQQWIEDGRPRSRVFSEQSAICGSWARWCMYHYQFDNLAKQIGGHKILSIKFKQGYEYMDYPFNDGRIDYEREVSGKGLWTNQERLNFVKEMAG